MALSRSTSSEEGGMRMSNKSGKTALLRSRGNAKSSVTLSQLTGRKSGDALRAALYEVYDEMTPFPPVTAAEARKFCAVNIRRCQDNLRHAEHRGDKRAVANLQKKLAVYDYLYRAASDGVEECPNCRVFAMRSGVCSCCGMVDASFIRAGTVPGEVVK